MIIEPGKQERKLKSYLDEGKYKNVFLVFWHGLGDAVQFMLVLDCLKELYPGIHFHLGLLRGLDLETVYPEAVLITDLKNIEEGFDLTVLLNFPVEIPGLTKSELCCREELGIPLVSGYKPLPKFPGKLVAVHFNLTCLPTLANPTEETAEKIWNEIREAGFIPIEVHFSHVFDNPDNKKFGFVDCTVRKCVARVASLIGLIQHCTAFVGVVSGPFHCAMATMPHDRIAFLEKAIPVARFTHEKIQTFDINNYRGGVKEWLSTLT